MQKTTTKANLTFLFEGDMADNNYTVYIPELRLGAVGDTVEEARANALDLAYIERDRLRKHLTGNNDTFIEKVEIDLGK